MERCLDAERKLQQLVGTSSSVCLVYLFVRCFWVPMLKIVSRHLRSRQAADLVATETHLREVCLVRSGPFESESDGTQWVESWAILEWMNQAIPGKTSSNSHVQNPQARRP